MPRIFHCHGLCSKHKVLRPNVLVPRAPSIPYHLLHRTYTNHHRQDDEAQQQQTRIQAQLQPEQSESIKPESFQETRKAKHDDAARTDALLSEQTITSKEQRQADWAIMKEMARYLWPKVSHVYVAEQSIWVKVRIE